MNIKLATSCVTLSFAVWMLPAQIVAAQPVPPERADVGAQPTAPNPTSPGSLVPESTSSTETGPEPTDSAVAASGRTSEEPCEKKELPKNNESYEKSLVQWRRIVPFQDDTFVAIVPSSFTPYGGEQEQYLLEGDINLYLGWDNTTRAFTKPDNFRWSPRAPIRVYKSGPKAEGNELVTQHRTVVSMAVTGHFSSQFRMLRKSLSSPVRLPTYKPGASILLLVRHVPVTVGNAGIPIGIPRNSGYWGVRATIQHYSNGQQGCSWDETLLDMETPCEARWNEILDSDVRLQTNRVNGDFSSNWVRWGVGGGWVRNQAGADHADRLPLISMEFFVEVGHEIGGVIGAMHPKLRDLYGRTEITPFARIRLNPPKFAAPMGFEVQARIRHYPDRAARADTSKTGCELRFLYWLPAMRGLGLFTEYQGGTSPHSLLFSDHLRQIMSGLVVRFGEQVRTGNSFFD